mmetsp:Transcript_14877/g.10779  ORF Transcript_14877/g.10779 Transcript_14877/m.10779 type:complete len:89 (-) Transcript_14877:636-902(-)
MGGTEIFAPLKYIFDKAPDPNLRRQIYLLTDGAVHNTEAIIDLIESQKGKCRVHTFGVGSGASPDLIKNGALAGGGHYSFIFKPEQIE